MKAPKFMTLACALLLVVTNMASQVTAETWKSTGLGGVIYTTNNQVGDAGSVETGMNWSGFRFGGRETVLSLIEVGPLVDSRLGTSPLSDVKRNEDGSVSTFDYSLQEVWDVVSTDLNVIAVIPVGYLERGGIPQIAGLIRIDGKNKNPLMHAPTLTNVFCLDNILRRESRGLVGPEVAQWHYTYPVRYDARKKYQYVSGLSAVVLDQEGYSAQVQENEFEACENLIQSGPRIIEPRRRLGENGLVDRRSTEIRINDQEWGYRASRTVLSFDLRGELTVMSSRGPAKLSYFADVIENPGFYRSSPSNCQKEEMKSGGDGPTNASGKRTPRTKACEYWAIGLTSFEHSGFILRTSANPNAKPYKFGMVDRTIPSALVLRKR